MTLLDTPYCLCSVETGAPGTTLSEQTTVWPFEASHSDSPPGPVPISKASREVPVTCWSQTLRQIDQLTTSQLKISRTVGASQFFRTETVHSSIYNSPGQTLVHA